MPVCFGNEEVIFHLETLLTEARQGKAAYFAAIMLSDSGEKLSGGWSGLNYLEQHALESLDQLSIGLNAAVFNKKLPDRSGKEPADRVCYNLTQAPTSYDAINWLADAEATRLREGAPAPLKVCFWFGRDHKSGLESELRSRMFHHVVKPALALFGAVEDPTAIDGRIKNFYSTRDIVSNYRQGEPMPELRAPAGTAAGMRAQFGSCVTITLRETSYFTERNSNIEAWLKFASCLKDQGERVVFVRDTAKAHEPIDGFETCAEASIDLHCRLALYEAAKINMFVSNGPSSLGLYSRWPWLTFIKVEPEGHGYAPATASFWKDNVGVEVGSQYPWSSADQRIIWSDDTYENLVDAWEYLHGGAERNIAAE
jgi:hypothetical protein